MEVISKCHQCASLRNALHLVFEQSTYDLPDAVAMTYAVDAFKRAYLSSGSVQRLIQKRFWLKTDAAIPRGVH